VGIKAAATIGTTHTSASMTSARVRPRARVKPPWITQRDKTTEARKPIAIPIPNAAAFDTGVLYHSGDIAEHWPKRPFDRRNRSLSSEHISYRGDVATAHVPQGRQDEAGSATYRHPRSWTVRFLVGGAAAMAALAVLVVFAFRDGQVLLTSILLVLTLALFVPEGWLISHVAREISVSDVLIRSRPFFGRATSLGWPEIESAEQFIVFSLERERPRVYRLVARGGRSVTFTSQIGEFDELLSAIRTRTTVLDDLASPAWWKRLIFRGFP
jgi:hypothetical protein